MRASSSQLSTDTPFPKNSFFQQYFSLTLAFFLVSLCFISPVSASKLYGPSFEFSTLNSDEGFRISGPSAEFGQNIVNIGDFNGDGVPDFLFGFPSYSSPGSISNGKVLALMGNPSTNFKSSISVFTTLTLTIQNNWVGLGNPDRMTALGDFNQDGYDDFAISSPTGSDLCNNGRTDPGWIAIFPGFNLSSSLDLDMESNATEYSIIICGANNGINLGYSLSGGLDFNGDNIPDLISVFENGGYILSTLFGNSSWTSLINTSNLLDPNSPQSFILGASFIELIPNSVPTGLAWWPDADLDGKDEAVFIIPGWGIFVVRGNSSIGTMQYSFGSDFPLYYGFDPMGFDSCSITPIGDIDGDGRGDIAIGAQSYFYESQPSVYLTGVGFIVYGSENTTTPSQSTYLDAMQLTVPSYLAFRNTDSSLFTAFESSASLGDFNGDGYPDVAFGSANAGLSQSGKSYVYFGTGSREIGVFPATSTTFDSYRGFSLNGINSLRIGVVAQGGDYNGDGYQDLVVGSSQSGTVYTYILFGKPSCSAHSYLSSGQNCLDCPPNSKAGIFNPLPNSNSSCLSFPVPVCSSQWYVNSAGNCASCGVPPTFNGSNYNPASNSEFECKQLPPSNCPSGYSMTTHTTGIHTYYSCDLCSVLGSNPEPNRSPDCSCSEFQVNQDDSCQFIPFTSTISQGSLASFGGFFSMILFLGIIMALPQLSKKVRVKIQSYEESSLDDSATNSLEPVNHRPSLSGFAVFENQAIFDQRQNNIATVQKNLSHFQDGDFVTDQEQMTETINTFLANDGSPSHDLNHLGRVLDMVAEMIYVLFIKFPCDVEKVVSRYAPHSAVEKVFDAFRGAAFLPGNPIKFSSNDYLSVADVFIEFNQFIGIAFSTNLLWSTFAQSGPSVFRAFLFDFPSGFILFFSFAVIGAFTFFFFWFVNVSNLKNIAPTSWLRYHFVKFCELDDNFMPYLSTVFLLPIFSNLLAPFRCSEYYIPSTQETKVLIDASVEPELSDPFVNEIYCDSDLHNELKTWSLICLLLFVPPVLTFYPKLQYRGQSQILYKETFLILNVTLKLCLSCLSVFIAGEVVPGQASSTDLLILILVFVSVFVYLLFNIYQQPCYTLPLLNRLRTQLLICVLLCVLSGFVAYGVNDAQNNWSGVILVISVLLGFGFFFRFLKEFSRLLHLAQAPINEK